jgi:hypothetical protein
LGKGDDVRILTPEIYETEVENGETVLQISGDDATIRRAQEYAKANGIKLYEARRPHLIVELSYEIRLSNALLRRAIGRLAIQYFSIVAPDEARGDGAAALRAFVRSGAEPAGTDPVWLDHDTNTYAFVPQSHRFGHRVALALSRSEQRVFGHVSLYGCFGYGVDLGPAVIVEDESHVWDINPLAEREPNDQVHIRPPLPLRFERPRPITRLEGLLRIAYLTNELRKRKWFLEAPTIVDAVNATRPMSLEDSSRGIADVLASQRQRVLALANESTQFLEFWLTNPRRRALVKSKFRRLISARRRGLHGVAPHTWRLVEHLRSDLATAIAKRLIARPINAWDLCAFLIGLTGQAIALRRLSRMSGSRVSIVSEDTALDRINRRNTDSLRAAEELRTRCRSSANAASIQ